MAVEPGAARKEGVAREFLEKPCRPQIERALAASSTLAGLGGPLSWKGSFRRALHLPRLLLHPLAEPRLRPQGLRADPRSDGRGPGQHAHFVDWRRLPVEALPGDLGLQQGPPELQGKLRRRRDRPCPRAGDQGPPWADAL